MGKLNMAKNYHETESSIIHFIMYVTLHLKGDLNENAKVLIVSRDIITVKEKQVQ